MGDMFYEPHHDLYRHSVRSFLEREVVPYHEKWEQAGLMDRDVFRKAGEAGFLGFAAPSRWGGGNSPDFRYNMIMSEESVKAGVANAVNGLTLQSDICLPYFLHATSEDQRDRWLPGICSGELVTAIAMTEPHAGSDLASMRTTAVRHGDQYVVNGAKIFISNGVNADLVILACKTDPTERHRGITLLVVETEFPGFVRGRTLHKMGRHSQDTVELFFDDMTVPVENRLGDEGSGFSHLMRNLAQERLHLAALAQAYAEHAFDIGLAYAKERTAFGQAIGSFQHNRFLLAELRTELDIGRAYVERQVLAHNAGALPAPDAAKAKWWCTELCKRTVDACLQLHGGYGYMEEYPIAALYRDTRLLTIVGGTTEIMKDLIGRSMGL